MQRGARNWLLVLILGLGIWMLRRLSIDWTIECWTELRVCGYTGNPDEHAGLGTTALPILIKYVLDTDKRESGDVAKDM